MLGKDLSFASQFVSSFYVDSFIRLWASPNQLVSLMPFIGLFLTCIMFAKSLFLPYNVWLNREYGLWLGSVDCVIKLARWLKVDVVTGLS